MDDLDFPGWQPAKSVEVVEGNGLTQVLVKGQPYMRWQSGDEGCTRLAIVQLYKCGLGTEEDLPRAFGAHTTSVQKYRRTLLGREDNGLDFQPHLILVAVLLLEKKVALEKRPSDDPTA